MEEKLILEVEKFPEIYDSSHRDYKDRDVRGNIFSGIAQRIGMKDGLTASARWKTLRDGFVRSRGKLGRKSDTKSGQSAKKKKASKFEKELEFLIPHIRHRNRDSNLDYASSNNESETDNEVDEEQPDPESPKSSRDQSITPPPTIPVVQSSKSRPKKKSGEDRLVEILETREKRRKDKGEDDEVELFFKSMARSVKKLPQLNQITVKRRIAMVVWEEEEKAFTKSAPSTSAVVSAASVPTFHAPSTSSVTPQPTMLAQDVPNIFDTISIPSNFFSFN